MSAETSPAAAADHAGIRIFPPGVYLLAIGLGWLVHRFWPLRLFPLDWGLARWAGGAGIVTAGALLALWADLAFRRVGTTPIPFRPTTALAFAGPYRFTRNPMYLGMAIAQAGAAVLVDSVWVLVLLPLSVWVIRRAVIDKEEAYLERKFGEPYREYKTKVRRWL
ncbi:MAG: isoprenylcysteine carboxylmethyltransferase family protein [Thermoanaerobaculia bacterium]